MLAFSTPRCRVDRVTPSDEAAVRSLFLDPVVRRHLGGPATEARASAVAAALPHDREDGGARAIRRLDLETAIGLLFLGPHHDGADVEVSYMLAPSHWGRGLATEVVGALLDRAWRELGLDRMVAETRAANAASRRVLEKVGMTPERRLHRFGAEQVLYAARLGRS